MEASSRWNSYDGEMAKRRRIIEGVWNCSSCGISGIQGRFSRCPSCGSPRETEEMAFDFGAEKPDGSAKSASVTDEALLGQARGGEDWHCGACGSGNLNTAEVCGSCGASRERRADSAMETPRSPKMPSVAGGSSGRRFVWFAGGLALLALCCGLGQWGAITHEEEGTVSSRTWKRTVESEHFTPVDAEGWRGDLNERPTRQPVNGEGASPGIEDIRHCVEKQRSIRRVPDGIETVCRTRRRQVPCGTERVCRPRTREVPCGVDTRCEVRDLGNGFAEEVCEDVPKTCEEVDEVCEEETKMCEESYEDCAEETRYREEPVLDDWCVYTTWAWQPAGRVVREGSEEPPAWPSDAPAGDAFRSERSAEYRVVVSWGEAESHMMTPDSASDFSRWLPGGAVLLDVSNLGEVQSAVPVGE